MATLFISDLHLEAQRPEMTVQFLIFLEQQAKQADALYILGDLFETWIGDDNLNDLSLTVINAIRRIVDHDIPVFLMVGNRDFLIGQQFAQSSGAQLLADPTVINLYGTPTLLMHGDTLCTDDTRYLEARARYRQPFYRKLFLSLPLFLRHTIAKRLRKASKKHTRHASRYLMDANRDAIANVMMQYDVKFLIHGHTHRPGIHYFQHQSNPLCRIVLSDWDKQGGVLIWEHDGTRRLVFL